MNQDYFASTAPMATLASVPRDKDATTFFLEIDDYETYTDDDSTTTQDVEFGYQTDSLFYECPVCQSYNCSKHNHAIDVRASPNSNTNNSNIQQFLNNNNILDTLKELEFNNNLNSNYLQSNYKKWLINLSPMH
jgi:hypothetical protein